MFFGRVEPLGAECIETKFFVLGVPLFPLESVYLLDESSRQGVVLPNLHGPSVLAGYLRVFLGLAMLLRCVFTFLDRHHEGWLGAVVLALLWFASMFFLGRLSKRERAQREVLKLLTGLGAPPSILPPRMRDATVERLTDTYLRLRAEDGFENDDWTQQRNNPELPMDVRLVVFALERYQGDEWDVIWEGIEHSRSTDALPL